MKLYIYYKTTDQPWGGVNSFTRGLKHYIAEKRRDIQLVSSFGDRPDVVMICAAQAGAGEEIDLKHIKKIFGKRRGLFGLFKNDKRAKFVHRLDGLRATYSDKMVPNDMLQIELSKMADFVIFQSETSLENFRRFGYNKQSYCIINNGVDQRVFNTNGRIFRDLKHVDKVKILAVSWSSSLNKGFETIAAFSALANTEVYFVGRWNETVDSKNVKLLPPLVHDALAKVYKDCDVFLHAACNDPCPNVVLEAMSCGLPVLYHPSGGTKELALKYGVPLPNKICEESLVDALAEVVNNHEVLRGYLLADYQQFSIENAAEKYIATFVELITPKKGQK